MASPTPTPPGLAALFQGIQLPLYPDNMRDLPAPQQKWINDLYEYLRRLAAAIASVTTTIVETRPPVGLSDWQYNTTTHTFQVKRFLGDGSISDWTNTGGGQPVKIDTIVEELDVTAGALSDITRHDTYVLQMGGETTAGTGCVCGGGLITACWFEWVSILSDGVWSDPIEQSSWCGTPPAGVAIGEWNYSGTTATFFQMGDNCSSNADCTTFPTAPNKPAGCDPVYLATLPAPVVTVGRYVDSGSNILFTLLNGDWHPTFTSSYVPPGGWGGGASIGSGTPGWVEIRTSLATLISGVHGTTDQLLHVYCCGIDPDSGFPIFQCHIIDRVSGVEAFGYLVGLSPYGTFVTDGSDSALCKNASINNGGAVSGGAGPSIVSA